MSGTGHQEGGWQRIDGAAFGIIYGAIMVLSILLAAGDHPDAPFETAAVLFGSVLAITLAKTFAEFLAHALDTGERLTGASWRQAWRHSAPTLAVANLPTLFFVAAGAGWLSAELAVLLSQAVCIGLLVTLGMRVGWVLEGKVSAALLGGVFAGGAGLLLALLKFVIH